MPTIIHNGERLQFTWAVSNTGVGPGEETMMADQARASLVAQVPYDQRHRFADAVVGYSYASIEGPHNKRVLRRVPPLQYPDHPEMYCVGITRSEGWSPRGATEPVVKPPAINKAAPLFVAKAYQQPDYLVAKMVLQFATLPYPVRGDDAVLSLDANWVGLPDDGDALASAGTRRYIRRDFRPAGKLTTLPQAFLYYVGTNPARPVLQALASKFIPAADISYTWVDIPEEFIPFDAITACMGAVNDDEFDGFAAETLLLQQPQVRPTVSPLGRRTATLVYTMRYLPNWDDAAGVARGHNYFLRVTPTGTLEYAAVSTIGTGGPGAAVAGGTKPYRTADFRDLFRLAQP